MTHRPSPEPRLFWVGEVTIVVLFAVRSAEGRWEWTQELGGERAVNKLAKNDGSMALARSCVKNICCQSED